MDKIVILLVSYIKDIEYVKRLIISYKLYNIDKIPLYIAVPAFDIESFKQFKCDDIELFTMESITNNLVNDNT